MSAISKKYRKKNNRKTKSKRISNKHRKQGGNGKTSIKELIDETTELHKKFDKLKSVIENEESQSGENTIKKLNKSTQKLKNDFKNLDEYVDTMNDENKETKPNSEETPQGNHVTVKIYPNNTPGTSELTIGDYRVKVNKNIPGDIPTVEHFLTNTMKYIKRHVDKYKNHEVEPENSIFPNTKFNYVFVPTKKINV